MRGIARTPPRGVYPTRGRLNHLDAARVRDRNGHAHTRAAPRPAVSPLRVIVAPSRRPLAAASGPNRRA
jgi:hypothetical protein